MRTVDRADERNVRQLGALQLRDALLDQLERARSRPDADELELPVTRLEESAAAVRALELPVARVVDVEPEV